MKKLPPNDFVRSHYLLCKQAKNLHLIITKEEKLFICETLKKWGGPLRFSNMFWRTYEWARSFKGGDCWSHCCQILANRWCESKALWIRSTCKKKSISEEMMEEMLACTKKEQLSIGQMHMSKLLHEIYEGNQTH